MFRFAIVAMFCSAVPLSTVNAQQSLTKSDRPALAKTGDVRLTIELGPRKRTVRTISAAQKFLASAKRAAEKSPDTKFAIALHVGERQAAYDNFAMAEAVLAGLAVAEKAGTPLEEITLERDGKQDNQGSPTNPFGLGDFGGFGGAIVGGEKPAALPDGEKLGPEDLKKIQIEMQAVQARTMARINRGEAGFPPNPQKLEKIFRDEIDQSKQAGRLPYWFNPAFGAGSGGGGGGKGIGGGRNKGR